MSQVISEVSGDDPRVVDFIQLQLISCHGKEVVMGLLSTILEKLGLAPSAAQAAPQAAPTATAPSRAITLIDVVAQLESRAAKHKEKLNWKVSIVDLLKLLGIDSSLAARKDLATELGCPPETMSDSVQMNMWLHKTVMKKLADNGGNIPQELLE
jgi:Domain of unknown function (DUF3597)